MNTTLYKGGFFLTISLSHDAIERYLTKEADMSRLDHPKLYYLSRNLFGDHSNMNAFHLLYETEEGLIPSESLLGDSDKDFEPNMFAGLVFDNTGVNFTSFGYTFDKLPIEDIDVLELIGNLPGIGIVDNELIKLAALGAAQTIAAITMRASGDDVVARLYINPFLDRAQAIGLLKGAISEYENNSTEEELS